MGCLIYFSDDRMTVATCHVILISSDLGWPVQIGWILFASVGPRIHVNNVHKFNDGKWSYSRGLYGHGYGLFVSDSPLFPRSMVRIFAGYIIEQDELVRFLKAQGWGPEPGEPEFTVEDAWMNFMSWRGAQPRHGDLKSLFPWPQCVSHFPLSVHADIQFSLQIGTIRMEIMSMPS